MSGTAWQTSSHSNAEGECVEVTVIEAAGTKD